MAVFTQLSKLSFRTTQSFHTLLDIDPLDVLPLLTVVLLLTSAPDIWYLRTPLILLCATGLVFRTLLRRPALWYLAATLLGGVIYLNWESADNHKYLMCYWCLALCCAFSLPKKSQGDALALSSRWLIGLCMLLAAVWKIGSADYVSGAFFQFELLADERFAYFTRLLSGVSAEQLADNRDLRMLLADGYLRGIEVSEIALTGSPQVSGLAHAVTWWTVLIEGALGVAFLAPNRPWIAKWRNALLLAFAVSTYSVATVRGFGWMLMLLGLAQCSDREKGFRLGYVLAFLLIQAYMLPIGEIADVIANWMAGETPCNC